MATQSHGYYGLGTSRTADFGLAASLTLPITTTFEDTQDSSNPTVPTEKTSAKKRTAKFAPEVKDHQDSLNQDLLAHTKKPSWKQRLTGIFRRNSQKNKSLEEPRDPLDSKGNPTGRTPMKTVDDLEVDLRNAKGKRKKKPKRSNSTAFDKFSSEGYLSDLSQRDLLKLALKPKGASNDFEAIKVTLHHKSDGFGIHLSGGLPPISVTFVQPGSEAESARIMVGDIVTEVNGQSCLKEVDISRIMGLKSLIQQSSTDAEEKRVDDTAWEKIKEKQVELESDNSGEGEITRIDDSSESENEQNVSSPMKDQSQKITKDKAAPKTSTPKKATKKSKNKPSSQLSPVTSEKPEDVDVSTSAQFSPNNSQNVVTVGVIKKKRRKKTTSTDKDISQDSKVLNSIETPPAKPSAKDDRHVSVPVKSAEPASGSRKRNKTKSKGKPKKKKVPAAPSTDDTCQSARDQGNSTRDQSSLSSSGFNVDSITAPKDLEYVDSGDLESALPASNKRTNKHRRKSDGIINTDSVNSELLQPISNGKRSTSHHDMNNGGHKMFREELKQASKSEYDMQNLAQVTDGPIIDIDPNVRVKKSGVVIGKRKTTERPSIFETDDGEKEDTGEKKEGEKHHRKLVMDITAVPETVPSLGLKHGHERLDVVTRSLSKRRPASYRRSLLLDTNKEVLMGKERVNLSEKGDVAPLRRGTMPEKMLRNRETRNSDPTPKEATNASTGEPVSLPLKQNMVEEATNASTGEPVSLPLKQSMVECESLQRSRYSSLSGSQSSGPHRPHEEQTTDNNTNTKLDTNDEKKVSGAPFEVKYEIPKIGGQRSKTVEQPVKKLGIASEPGKPEWISIAQTKQNRMNVSHGDEKTPGKQSPVVTPIADSPKAKKFTASLPPVTRTPPLNGVTKKTQDDSIPKMGTVKDRLAMFQKVK